MRRGLRIVVALAAVLLLVHPLDCFAARKTDQKARDCCKKGHCKPSNSDDCCKATVQDGDQILASKATDHSAHVLDFLVAEIRWRDAQPRGVVSLFVRVTAFPGSPPGSRSNLPLLI
ncbi:MAG: hypothetical protein JWN34_2296 [Bryobacterales bacterium]|nr:hypothetical protein [Bryobacterales bacterium]